MPKCKDCRFCIGYDVISSCFICDATSEIDYIGVEWAEDDEIGCELYVNDSNDDTSARS